MRIGEKLTYWYRSDTVSVGQCVDLIINDNVVETITIAYIHYNRDSADKVWFGKENPYTGEYIGKSKFTRTYSKICVTTNKGILRRKMIEALELI